MVPKDAKGRPAGDRWQVPWLEALSGTRSPPVQGCSEVSQEAF